jgi:hypothetical protein
MAYTAPTVVASGTTFAQFQAGGASGHLERLIAAQGTTAAPTSAATATATGGGLSGGSLVAGTYYFVFTESNGFGETTASPQGSQLAVASGNQPQFTFPSLRSGNTSRNLYLGAAGGPSGGPYTLYASGITTSTYTAAAAAPTNSYAVNPPTFNTTGLTYTDTNGIVHNEVIRFLRSHEKANDAGGMLYQYLRALIADFNHGGPSTVPNVIQKLRHAHAAYAMLSTLCAEMGALIDANAGTLGTAATGIGGRQTIRRWP